MKYISEYHSSGALIDNKSTSGITGGVTDLAKIRGKKQLEALYREHHHSLCGWLMRRYGKHAADAEEIAHKAFARLLELENLDSILNLKAFLYTVAVNFALLDVRSHATSQKFIEQELHLFSENVEEMTPERIYSAEKRGLHLIKGIELLSEKQKKILYLSRIEGKSYEQITEQTGWSQADISRQLKKSLSIIREELAKKSVGEG